MYCPDCGKQIEEQDKFCRFCGKFLTATPPKTAPISEDNTEEVVLYTAKKHIMGLLWPLIMSPFFITLFWKIYISTNSMFSTIFGMLLIVPVIFSILQYCSEGIVITNKFIHIERGTIEIQEIRIPVEKADAIRIDQSFFGNLLGYCDVYFYSPSREKRQKLSHFKDCDRLDAIFANMDKYISAAMEEPELEAVNVDTGRSHVL